MATHALHSPAEPAALPIAEINTTPLIDVMLVLLIMFVITIPVATHTLDVDLPIAGAPGHPVMASNRIDLGADSRIRWNGAEVTLPQLATLLSAGRTMRPEPEVRFAPDALAPYGTAARIVATIKASGVGGFGFVGNEQFADFGKAAPRR